ncbi:hypothetical protein [Arthrobacter sp. Soil762]|nr:hypothetical protein [Arthrobacter sp. Soil762]
MIASEREGEVPFLRVVVAELHGVHLGQPLLLGLEVAGHVRRRR